MQRTVPRAAAPRAVPFDTVQGLVVGARPAVRLRVLLVGAGAAAMLGTSAVAFAGGRIESSWRLIGLAAALTTVAMADSVTDRVRRERGRGRLAWATLGAAGVLLSGSLALLVAWPDGRTVLVLAAFFVSAPFFGLGVLLLPAPAASDLLDRWRAFADAVAAALGLAVAAVAMVSVGQPDWPAAGSLSVQMLYEVISLTMAVFVLSLAVAQQRRPGGIPARQLTLILVAATTILTASVVAVRDAAGIPAWPAPLVAILMVAGSLIATTPALFPVVEPEGTAWQRWRDTLAEFLPFVPMAAGLLTVVWFATQPIPLPYVLGTAMSLLVVGMMIAFAVARTLSWRAARRLRDQEVRRGFEQTTQDVWFQALVAGTDDVVCVLDLTGRLVYESPSARTRLGWIPDATLGQRLDHLLASGGEELGEAIAVASRDRTAPVRVPVTVPVADAPPRPHEAEIRPLAGATGLYGYVVTLHDVAERQELTAALRQQELTDPLTGLPNRSGFLRSCEGQLAVRGTGDFAIVAFDVARFGLVNDTLGHHIGDDLLRRIAAILVAESGPAEVGPDAYRHGQAAHGLLPAARPVAVGRVGGDEFAVLVCGDEGAAALDRDIANVTAELQASLAGLGSLAGTGLPISCHVGYATCGEEAARPVELLRRAEIAVGAARAAGGPAPVVYDGDAHAQRIADAVLEAELRRGLESGQLVLHYQPVVDLARGGAVGVEALVRWAHPGRGLLGPDAFIPAAERSGLIHRVGEQVLRQALADLPRLREASGRHGLDVAVNVSAHQVTAALPDDVLRLLAEAGVPPESLVIEVTESAIFSRPREARPALESLRASGVRVALDDFGTGYSSLALLARVPVDALKVDRSFTNRIEAAGEELALVRGILQLSQSLGLTSTAEGVETRAQADILRAMGCQHAQGYLFARPLPLDEAIAWLRARRTAGAAGA